MSSRPWAPPAWLSLALLAGAGVYLVSQWHLRPAPGSQVVGPVILLSSGIFVILMLEGVSHLSGIQLKGETNKHLNSEVNEELKLVTRDIMRIVELALAIPFSVGTLFGLGRQGGIHPLFALISFASVGLAVIVACRRLVKGYTLGFAHSRSWLILALLVSPVILVAILGAVVKVCSGIIH